MHELSDDIVVIGEPPTAAPLYRPSSASAIACWKALLLRPTSSTPSPCSRLRSSSV